MQHTTQPTQDNTPKKTDHETDLEFVLSHAIRGLCAEETETIIIINKSEPFAMIETTDNTKLTRLKKLLRANPRDWRLVDHTVDASDPNRLISVTVECPKNFITLRSGVRTVEPTPEEREKRLENLKKVRAARLANTNPPVKR